MGTSYLDEVEWGGEVFQEKKKTCTKVLKQEDETLTRAVLLERLGTCRAFVSVKDCKFLSQ